MILVDGSISIVASGWGYVCQNLKRFMAFVDRGFGDFGRVWGLTGWLWLSLLLPSAEGVCDAACLVQDDGVTFRGR